MIKEGALPIHGSMVKITMKGGKQVHLVIMGDSGAGKSESIEAFRLLAKEYLESITVIFDDMGTLFYQDGKVTAAGTEIGAFVRPR
jgi:serine kinase of HPr protein (carbohydrate metabolism regulator)